MLGQLHLKYLTPTRDGRVVVRGRGFYLGVFSSVGKAKAAIAKQLKVPIGKLPLRKRTQTSAVVSTRYRHVYSYGRHGPMVARIGPKYLGSFSSAAAAAAAVAREMSKTGKTTVSAKSLLKAQGKQEGPKFAKMRFRIIKRIFKHWRPNDLVSSQKLSKLRQARLLVAAPGPLWNYFILGKETKYRLGVLSGWARLSSGEKAALGVVGDVSMFGKPESIAAARTIYTVLRDAAGKLNGDLDEHDYWAKHTHTGVTHHSGWLPMLQRLKILKKVTAARRRAVEEGGERERESRESERWREKPCSLPRVRWDGKVGIYGWMRSRDMERERERERTG